MKIIDIKLLKFKTVKTAGSMEPAWDLGGQMTFQVGGRPAVEIHTDEGLVGIGPGITPNLLETFKTLLVGEDPFDTEQHMARLRYYARGAKYQGSASIDIALWDLIGKACGQPLYKLWGGGKAKVPAYASLIQLSTPAERADLATQLLAEGWQALKLRIHHTTIKEDVATVEAVRDAVGDKMEIMVDANQAQSSGNWQPGILWDYRRALETARELERLGCYWLEEPLPRYAFEQLAQLNRDVAIPIAGGENNIGIHEFRQMVEQNVYDVLQPEGMVMEGLTSLRKIGVLGEVFGKKVVPHHGGGNLGVVAHLHLVASWSHAPYLELLHDPPVGHYQHGFSMMQNPPVVDEQGYMLVPQGPGLGVDLNRDLIEEIIS